MFVGRNLVRVPNVYSIVYNTVGEPDQENPAFNFYLCYDWRRNLTCEYCLQHVVNVVDGDARVSRDRSFSQMKDFKDLDCHLHVPIQPG